MSLLNLPTDISPVVEFNKSADRLLPMDFTAKNAELTNDILGDTATFSEWVDRQLEKHHLQNSPDPDIILSHTFQ